MFRKRYFKNSLADYQKDSGVRPLKRDKILAHIHDLKDQILDLPYEDKTSTGGLYLGIGGVGYGLWYLSLRPEFAREKQLLLEEALKRVKFGLEYRASLDGMVADFKKIRTTEAAYIIGDAGLFGTAALICNEMDDIVQRDEFLNKLLQTTVDYDGYLDTEKPSADEYLFGRTGVLCGMLLLRKHIDDKAITDTAVSKLLNTLVESMRHFAKLGNAPQPLMNVCFGMEFAGPGHGLASALQILLSFPEITKSSQNEQFLSDIKQSVDSLLSLQAKDGNFPFLARKTTLQHKLLISAYVAITGWMVHWCHGATGFIFMLATAYKQFHDEKYLKACELAAECVWNQGLLKKGPGICHGTSGSAYAFLMMYRLTKDEKYLYRAHRFAEFMLSDEFKRGARTPDNPMSLFEGLAGTLCFYLDLLTPEDAEFPVFPVIF